jgi:hypothetical protein
MLEDPSGLLSYREDYPLHTSGEGAFGRHSISKGTPQWLNDHTRRSLPMDCVRLLPNSVGYTYICLERRQLYSFPFRRQGDLVLYRNFAMLGNPYLEIFDPVYPLASDPKQHAEVKHTSQKIRAQLAGAGLYMQ